MANFRFIAVDPLPLLKPYVAKIQVYESSGRLPSEERKLIVPNANLKLTLTYRNGIVAGIGNNTFSQSENKLSLTGLIDIPVLLDSTEDAQTGTIIVEFHPLGAYRFFRLSYAEVQNQIVELRDLIGLQAEELRTRLMEHPSILDKLRLLQDFLVKQLERTVADPIYDYCIHRIVDTSGLISVAQLEKETGYSARWLHHKFLERLGTGSKNFSEIVRFKQFYLAYSSGVKLSGLKDQIYQYYHDQSHFLRSFKRFTGTTPTELQNSLNELANRHFST